MKNAVVFGANGLVGKELVSILNKRMDYTRVIAVVRNPLPEWSGLEYNKLNIVQISLESEDWRAQIKEKDDVYVALGTTIAKAGSEEAFIKVDKLYPMKIAEEAKRKKVHSYAVVTAMGSNPQSPIFYNRVKGETETELVGYGIERLGIFRPSLLLGDRSEFRLFEIIASWISHIIPFGWLPGGMNYKPVPAKFVARAMVNWGTRSSGMSVEIFGNDKIYEMSED
jgi:uncharacterized protein YbjT (DUF2867 family)